MGFTQSKDLDYYEKGRKKMGFGRSKELRLYRNIWKKNRRKMGCEPK